MQLSAIIEQNKQSGLLSNSARTNPIEEIHRISAQNKIGSTITEPNQPNPLNILNKTTENTDRTGLFRLRTKNTEEKPLKINRINFSTREIIEKSRQTPKNAKFMRNAEILQFLKPGSESHYKAKHGLLREEEERELANDRKKGEFFEPMRKIEEKPNFASFFEKSQENFEKLEKPQNLQNLEKFDRGDKNKGLFPIFDKNNFLQEKNEKNEKPQLSFEKPLNFLEKPQEKHEELKNHKKSFKKQLIHHQKTEILNMKNVEEENNAPRIEFNDPLNEKNERNTKEIIENFKKKQKNQKPEIFKGKKEKRISKSKRIFKDLKEEIEEKEENLLVEKERIKSSKNMNNSNILVKFAKN